MLFLFKEMQISGGVFCNLAQKVLRGFLNRKFENLFERFFGLGNICFDLVVFRMSDYACFDWRAYNQSNCAIAPRSWARGVRQNVWDWLQVIPFLPTPSPFSLTASPLFPIFLLNPGALLLTCAFHSLVRSPPGKGKETAARQASSISKTFSRKIGSKAIQAKGSGTGKN